MQIYISVSTVAQKCFSRSIGDRFQFGIAHWKYARVL